MNSGLENAREWRVHNLSEQCLAVLMSSQKLSYFDLALLSRSLQTHCCKESGSVFLITLSNLLEVSYFPV